MYSSLAVRCCLHSKSAYESCYIFNLGFGQRLKLRCVCLPFFKGISRKAFVYVDGDNKCCAQIFSELCREYNSFFCIKSICKDTQQLHLFHPFPPFYGSKSLFSPTLPLYSNTGNCRMQYILLKNIIIFSIFRDIFRGFALLLHENLFFFTNIFISSHFLAILRIFRTCPTRFSANAQNVCSF